MAAVDREISGRRGVAAQEQQVAAARKAKQVKDIGRRSVGNTAHRVGQLMKRDPEQQVRIDVSGKGGAAIIGRGVIGTK